MSKDRDPYFAKVWTKIEQLFDLWRWRLFTLFYLLCSISFYVWVARGTDFPQAAEALLWAAPLLVAFILKVFIDTHIKIADFVEPDSIGSRECVHLLFERLRSGTTMNHTQSSPIVILSLHVGTRIL